MDQRALTKNNSLDIFFDVYSDGLQGSRWAKILGRSDFSLDTDLGRMERLGHKGLHKTGCKQISIRERLELHLTRVLTRKNAPPPGGHVFQPTAIIFELVQDIIGMNLLTYLGPETQFQKLVTGPGIQIGDCGSIRPKKRFNSG
ncbi:hypothetical protein DPMN_151748 [Dreissena polymorpha]|uniref:Uncharacterized protein n=1 Tax=Dreissena polymorpha TaxID=45954 RepID=A0A9D4FFY4_DREPO|nr:hypothetical protein DPMN_151748 [Dreissena polymorpha]